MKWANLALAACAASLGCSGSGGDFCSQRTNVVTALVTKGSACLDGGVPIVILPPATQCETQLASCSSSDQAKLSSLDDCVLALPTCQASQSLTWLAELLVCGSNLQGLSQACVAAGLGDAGL